MLPPPASHASRPHGSRSPSAPIRLVAFAAALATLAAAVVVLLPGARDDVDRGTAHAASAVPVTVTLDTHRQGRTVPRRFLGLSFEVSALHEIASFADSGNLVGLLRSLGPGLLRFGGVSADTRVAWTDHATPRPAWASTVLVPADLRRLGRLAARSGWRVLLTVGLAHFNPRAAAREVAVARKALGRRLAAVEVGNEPDAYAKHQFRSQPWTAARYGVEFNAYRRRITRLTRGIHFAGPGVSGSKSFATWGRAQAAAQRPMLLTGHHYPLGCHQTPPPSIDRLLSPEIRGLEGQSLRRFMAVSRSSGVPVRLDEVGSVSCGGTAGISNTFASALWAAGYIAQSMSAGVSGINLEGNPANCHGYSAVCTPPGRAAGLLTAQPQWYSLLLAKALIGSRPLPTMVTRPSPGVATPAPPNLLAHGFIARDKTLRLVAVNNDRPGSRPVALRLPVGPRYVAASALALTGPSQTATAGVRLGGQAVASDGSWRGATRTPIAVRGGTVQVTVAPSSAVLLTVLRRG